MGEGSIISWIENYLRNWFQFVYYDGHTLQPFEVKPEVPQGCFGTTFIFALYKQHCQWHRC